MRQVAQDALDKAQEANPSLKGSVDNIQSAVRSTSQVLEKIKNNPEMKSALSQTKLALDAAAPVAKSVVSGTAKVVVSGSKVAAGDIKQESLEMYSTSFGTKMFTFDDASMTGTSKSSQASRDLRA